MTYDTKGIWRCYEIKVSKSDFYSKAKKSFVGHYNYYVMTYELYEEVKHDIPKEIGVYCYSEVVKNPKKQELKVEESILKDSMIRSLSREHDKFIKTNDTNYINRLKGKVSKLESQLRYEISDRIKMSNALFVIKNKYNIPDEVRALLNEDGEFF